MKFKIVSFRDILFICCLGFFAPVHAALWSVDNNLNRSEVNNNEPGVRYYLSDDYELRSFLNQVPTELSGQSLIIDLPMPDGGLSQYRIVESPMMEAGLAAKFPEIRTYEVYGIDDPGAFGRVDISMSGFRAMVITSEGRIFIDPEEVSNGISQRYMSRSQYSRQAGKGFQCGVNELDSNQLNRSSSVDEFRNASRVSGSILNYRLAVAATNEYYIKVGGSPASLATAQAAIVTTMNRVNVIYKRDLGIQLNLVANNDLLIDVANTSPLSGKNDDGIALIDVNQGWIESNIGAGDYDIGHVFSTGGGGLAALASVCSSSSSNHKAQGVTGSADPVGDPFDIDFVAHEIGHQFGAEHTFNGSTGSCFGNRNPATAFEPGSGTSILSYAGICGQEDLQSNSDATFHAGSIAEINAFVNAGGNCATTVPIPGGNTDPTANAGLDRVIPKETPFELGATGVANGGTASYQWSQMDAGSNTTADNLGSDLTNNALFRTYVPRASNMRHFPALKTQLQGKYDKAERLACTARDINFRLTVRDGQSGQATDDIKLTVNDASGPFKITSHTAASTFAATAGAVVTWDVANTNQSPVNCANVNIELLTFSTDQSTYAITRLKTATPNDGSETITNIPDSSNARARFKVSCSNNIFYDVSDADLNITGTGTFATTGNTVFDNTTNGKLALVDSIPGSCGVVTSSSGGGSGSFNIQWLLLLGMVELMLIFRRKKCATSASLLN